MYVKHSRVQPAAHAAVVAVVVGQRGRAVAGARGGAAPRARRAAAPLAPLRVAPLAAADQHAAH